MSIKKTKKYSCFFAQEGRFLRKKGLICHKKRGFWVTHRIPAPSLRSFLLLIKLHKKIFFTFFLIFDLFSTFLLNYVKISAIISSLHLFGGKVCPFTSI